MPRTDNEFHLENPEAQLERALIEEFLHTRGHTLESVRALPEAQQRQLLKEASVYAAGRLAEVESRSHLVHEIHGEG